jgi:anti-sigma factor RsiW
MKATGADCRAMLERMSAYLDGDLGPAECRAIERHCRGCPPCAVFVTSLRRTIGLCHEAAKRPLPNAIRRRAKARIRRLMSE